MNLDEVYVIDWTLYVIDGTFYVIDWTRFPAEKFNPQPALPS